MKWIKKVDKKFSIGLIVGLVFGLLSVYVDFFKSSDPELAFNILSNATVFDIKEDIGELDVLYDSTSLTKQGKTISLITVKVTNTGNESILREHFDSIAPLRIYIDGSKIVHNPQIIETNESYLNKSVSFSRISDNEFTINPFIFDKEKYFVVKLLAIHQQGFTPILKADGKIAKIENFEFLNSFSNQKKESFWNSVIHGSFLIHISRFFTYLFVLIIFSVLIILPIALISESVSKSKRRGLIKIFRKNYNKSISDSHEIIIEFYLDNGIYPIERLKRIINDQSRFKSIFPLINEDTSVGYLVKELKEQEIIKIEEGKVLIEEHFKLFLINFIRFMKE